jgi:Nucleotide-diphospho-sugar transferase.
MNFWNEPVEFLARQPQHVERLAPVYLALDEALRGNFYVPQKLSEQAQSLGLRDAIPLRGSVNQPLQVKPPVSVAPMVTCGYQDLLTAVRIQMKRPQIYVQDNEFKAAAHQRVSLFLCPNEERLNWVNKHWPGKPVEVCDSADRMAEAITGFVKVRSDLKSVMEVDGESIGILYMAFGEKAARAVRASHKSLRRVGVQIPACVVGSTPVDGMQFIEWTGESPFDASQKHNFQFRAGRIKPFLYGLTPFERTLYIDADTEFMEDILPGFEALSDYDVAIAREDLTLKQLYNKKLAGWEINLKERDATVDELQAGESVFFLNSGVLFFRKCAAVEAAMRRWHDEWMRWQQWDEQLAFMRAFHKTPEAKVKVLEPEWNFPHRKEGIVIFHNYGRGVVRMDGGEVSSVGFQVSGDPLRLRRIPPNSESTNLGEEATRSVEVMA